jgi:hypothetical protein
MMRAAVLALALALVGACGSSGGSDDTGGDSFIAFASSFADFHSWNVVHSDGPSAQTQPPQVLGPRDQFLNKLPPHGATEWPIGTMIVEVRPATATQDMKIFAGAKRAATFNVDGAKGWEWFELTDAPVAILWRGVGPPAGDMYGGDPNGGCNACHTACGATNDSICSAKLQLANF